MKPQQKVVTAQDVQSSLYYLHMASPSDYELLQHENPVEESSSTQAVPKEEALIARKPLPQNGNHKQNALPNLPYLPTVRNQSSMDNSSAGNQMSKQPSDDEVARLDHRNPDLPPRLLVRKLLGPRSMNQSLHSGENTTLQNAPQRQNLDMRRWSEQPTGKPPRLPPRPDSMYDAGNRALSSRGRERSPTKNSVEEQRDTKSEAISANHCWQWEKSWETKRASEARAEMAEVTSAWQTNEEIIRDASCSNRGASLSLIRRYNGEQWNVAKIEELHQGLTSLGPAEPSFGTLVEILTSGYSKFVDKNKSSDCRKMPEAPIGRGGRGADAGGEDKDGNVAFQRYLRLSKNARRPDTGRTPGGTDFGFHSQRMRPSFESRKQSSDSFQAFDSEQTACAPASSKGYVIESPWNGVCEFSTGVAGRSIKCKHAYSSTNPAFGPGLFSATASELRFNLPSSKVFGTPAAKSPGLDSIQYNKRSSLFLRSHIRRTSSFETDPLYQNENPGLQLQSEDRLDLSLGQEHAGGGFGGKQAKLGKLIVEAEGLQMLDLVVAANMALWWKVYERLT